MLLSLLCILAVGVAFSAETRTMMESQAKRSAAKRLVNGVATAKGEFPFMAIIELTEVGKFCGAVVLNENSVLTASACSEGIDIVGILAGEYDLLVDELVEQFTMWEETRLPSPLAGGLGNMVDLAVLRLSWPLSLIPGEVEAAILNSDPTCPAVGQICTVLGWGSDVFGGDPSTKLRKVDVQITDPLNCQVLYGNLIADRNICAGSVQDSGKEAGICTGDLGGPLICECGGQQKVVAIATLYSNFVDCRLDHVYASTASVFDFVNEASGSK